jgi:hypothetical protein
MKALCCHLLLLLLFFTVWHDSIAFAGEEKTHSVTIRQCVYWIPRYDPITGKSSPQFNRNRSLVYQSERNRFNIERDKVKILLDI